METQPTILRAVIWDMGGVIVRTDDGGPRTAMAERLGLTRADFERAIFEHEASARATVGDLSHYELWDTLMRSLKLQPSDRAWVEKGFWGGDSVDTDLVDYIRSLRPAYRTALLSNAWSDLRWHLVHEWKIADAFDRMIISSEVGLAKPDPRIYHLAVNRLGVRPEESVFIDDMPGNVEAARAAGLSALRFTSREQVLADLDNLLASTSNGRTANS